MRERERKRERTSEKELERDVQARRIVSANEIFQKNLIQFLPLRFNNKKNSD